MKAPTKKRVALLLALVKGDGHAGDDRVVSNDHSPDPAAVGSGKKVRKRPSEIAPQAVCFCLRRDLRLFCPYSDICSCVSPLADAVE